MYYNDYNEWFTAKRAGIVQLLKDVKEAEGTRIDGMGMQGHYQTVGSPTMEEFSKAARAYAEVVGQVQITELDMKASSGYDGTAATREEEFAVQGRRYKELYDTVKSLREEGVNISNITLWGVVDKNSWLQTFNAVGGAADGKQRQCPLLFDDDYQVKPAYWAFVDGSRLEEEKMSEESAPETAEASEESQTDPSGEENFGESAQESAAGSLESPAEESGESDQSETTGTKGPGKGLYGILAVCGLLVAGIAGFALVRSRKRDK